MPIRLLLRYTKALIQRWSIFIAFIDESTTSQQFFSPKESSGIKPMKEMQRVIERFDWTHFLLQRMDWKKGKPMFDLYVRAMFLFNINDFHDGLV